MRTIWKATVPVSDKPIIELPAGAVILSAGAQGVHLVVWSLVDPEAPVAKRQLAVFGTGHPFTINEVNWRFVDTVQMQPALIWHVWEYVG